MIRYSWPSFLYASRTNLMRVPPHLRRSACIFSAMAVCPAAASVVHTPMPKNWSLVFAFFLACFSASSPASQMPLLYPAERAAAMDAKADPLQIRLYGFVLGLKGG